MSDSEFLKPKGLDAPELFKARAVDFRFHNPPAYEQFGQFHHQHKQHGEFEDMQRVTGKMSRRERHELDRDRMSKGLADVQLTTKGRPL